MSFGFGTSPTEVIKVCQFCFKVYRECFTQARGAHWKYQRFGEEVNRLGKSLQVLVDVINNAQDQDPRQLQSWHRSSNRLGASLRPLVEITGDFRQTLHECDDFLHDHSKFGRNQANFIDNVTWFLQTERQVDSLRERISNHTTKIIYATKPFEISLLLEIRNELRALRRDVASLHLLVARSLSQYEYPPNDDRMQLDPIQPDVEAGFQDRLSVDKPKSVTDLVNLPLTETLNAFIIHFSKSTVEFNPGTEFSQNIPKEMQYLNLLKSSFILQKLKQSSHLRAFGNQSIWLDYVKELELDVLDQFHRFATGALVSPSLEVILRLPCDCFSIWTVEKEFHASTELAEPRAGEAKLLQLPLPNPSPTRRSTLTVFSTSDFDLRVVVTNTDDQNTNYRVEDSHYANMLHTSFVPVYASPSATGRPNNQVLLCGDKGQSPFWLSLNSPQDAELFQQAMTNYRVFKHMDNVHCSLDGSSNPEKSGAAKLQIWQHKPLEYSSQSEEAPMSPAQSSSPGASNRPSSSWMGSLPQCDTVLTGTTLLSTSSHTSVVRGSTNDGTALIQPENPTVVLFTMNKNRYTYLYFEWTDSISVNSEICECRWLVNTCTTVILEISSKKFGIKRLSATADLNNGLHSWNLARFRLPRHPSFEGMETLKKIKYIRLDFANPQEKATFLAEVEAIQKLKETNQQEFNEQFVELAQRNAKSPKQKGDDHQSPKIVEREARRVSQLSSNPLSFKPAQRQEKQSKQRSYGLRSLGSAPREEDSGSQTSYNSQRFELDPKEARFPNQRYYSPQSFEPASREANHMHQMANNLQTLDIAPINERGS